FVITVCAVIFLALKYGRINTSLEQQLIQVQVLSTKNLESEKEKQQILAGQNEKLEQQVTQRTSELANSLAELKSTQAQLIQTEKMASLGELTAGIAHEIQNPLNFVNNFSEVNQELLIELKEEMANGNLHDAAAIADDVIDNQEKITHHGKRADVIVKGMLQHSRSGSGEMHSTDINKLVDEYLRLAYHGLRAKEKSFNAKLETDYHENVGAVNIVPQDIGRAILNVITNAFYAITEKSKTGSANYQPTVWVSTKRNSNVVSISVQDNGNGISQTIIDKIFQPFFTTKPT
ncbi:MAG: ATP-binding protein, partial [Bacteroidota bacterium]